MARALAAGLLAVAAAGCTSVGFHSVAARAALDFGPPDTVALCLLLDDGISERQARALIDEAWREEGALYGLRVEVVQVARWPRPAFTMNGIIDALRRRPLAPGCDRVFALVGRNVGDFLWGLVGLPEVLGAVNDETLTHGYAVVGRVSLNQLLMSPSDVIQHEIYHLLGCDQHFRMQRCYEQIAALKRWKRQHGGDFFPGWDLINQRLLASREAVNARLRSVSAQTVGSLASR